MISSTSLRSDRRQQDIGADLLGLGAQRCQVARDGPPAMLWDGAHSATLRGPKVVAY